MICLLFNSKLSSERTPECWKTSIIIPLYKGNGKNKKLPNRYRPMSLLSCFNKVFEIVVLEKCPSFLKINGTKFPCSQQQGFQKVLSFITTSFNLQESVFYQIEQRSKAYVAYLDIKGAYDFVWHSGLFVKLGRLGINGKLLRVLKQSYERLKCVIRINGLTSTPVDVKRGVRQGGVLSCFLYMVYVDELITTLETSNRSAKVLSVNCGAPTFADDISLIAVSPYNLQTLVDIVYRYAQTWKFSISVEKSCVMVYTKVKKRTDTAVGILYGDEYIETVTNAIHLGIRQDSNLKINAPHIRTLPKG